MKKYAILTILGISILIGCTDNEVELPPEFNGTSTLNMQISSVGFGDNNTASRTERSSSVNITWNHVFGGTGTIVFTNTSTSTLIDSTYNIDMADFAVNGLSKTLINGSYDVNLTMGNTSPVAYVPVNATDSFDLTSNTDLVLDTNTTYGMILLDPYLIDISVSPTFDVAGTEYLLAEDQGYYYLYAPDGTTGTITLKESLFGQTVSKEITIASTTIDALELVPVTSSVGVSITLEEFTIESDQWDIDVPIGGVTPSFGLFTDSGQTLGSSDSHDLALGDLDGDGDLDAIVINRVQASKVWLNDGFGNFTEGQDLGNNDSLGVSLGDLDGDGDLDAFVANYSGQPNKVWFNDGSGNFIDSGQSLGNNDTGNVALGDVDGDGDLDAVEVSLSSQTNIVWINDGSGNFSDNGQSLGNSNMGIISLVDLDGDGDLDAMTGTWDQSNGVWINDGNGNFSNSGQLLGDASGGSKDISLGDVDRDGDLDAFMVDYLNQSSTVWLNNGNGVFTNSGQILISDQATGVSLKDLDGDGDLDAFVVYFDRPNKVWLNDGNGNFTDSGQLLGNSYSEGVSVGDLDGDGDLDAFVVDRDQPNKVWINN